jgi:hypothetical protein
VAVSGGNVMCCLVRAVEDYGAMAERWLAEECDNVLPGQGCG